MAESSWPSIAHPAVSRAEYEQLTHPTGGDGVVGTPADTTVVYADDSGLFVKFRANKFATIRGHEWTSGGSDFSKAVTSNASGLTRVDVAVLRLTRSTWDITAEVRAGIAGAGAPAIVQDLGTTGVFEIPVGYITVPSGDASIGASQVTRAEYYLGEQLIVCIAANRPGHAPGRRIYETDTGITYISTGAAWRLIQPGVFTSTTRPAHQVGLLIWESDTAQLVVSTGSDWRVVSGDSGWVNVTPASGWTAGNCRVRRKDGVAYAQWDLNRSGGNVAGNGSSTVFNLPSSAYFPAFQFFAETKFRSSTSGDGSARVAFNPDGSVQISANDIVITNSHVATGSTSWPLGS